MNDVLYVILNKSLHMSAGKAAAQTAHAVMCLQNKHREAFVSHTRRTVIVLAAENREQIDGIADYLSEASIDYEYYIDEGVNEVAPFSLTAMAVEPIGSDDATKREIFSGLSLYSNEEHHDYVEPQWQAIWRSINALQSSVQEVRRHIIAPKPKWYHRFKKKQGFIS